MAPETINQHLSSGQGLGESCSNYLPLPSNKIKTELDEVFPNNYYIHNGEGGSLYTSNSGSSLLSNQMVSKKVTYLY